MKLDLTAIIPCISTSLDYYSVLFFISFFFPQQEHAYPADELMPLTCRGRIRGQEPSRGDVDDALGKLVF